MTKNLNNTMYAAGAAFTVGMFSCADLAHAQAANNFSDIAENISDSISELPGMVSGISYMVGLLLGVLGIFKIKDHVENPGKTPMKDGAIRLAAGGALFALPIVMEAMQTTIGDTTHQVGPASLNPISFNTN